MELNLFCTLKKKESECSLSSPLIQVLSKLLDIQSILSIDYSLAYSVILLKMLGAAVMCTYIYCMWGEGEHQRIMPNISILTQKVV